MLFLKYFILFLLGLMYFVGLFLKSVDNVETIFKFSFENRFDIFNMEIVDSG